MAHGVKKKTASHIYWRLDASSDGLMPFYAARG